MPLHTPHTIFVYGFFFTAILIIYYELFMLSSSKHEPGMGIGPMTSFLPRKRSTTELSRRAEVWAVEDSNLWSPKACDLQSHVIAAIRTARTRDYTELS